MFLDDLFEHRGIARRVPHALGIDDGDRSALADAQAVGFRSENAALLGEAELLQPTLEEFPRRQTALFLAAFRIRLIAAEEDVTPRGVDADRLRDRALRVGCHQPSALHSELVGVPFETELAWRRHVAEERGGGDDRGAGEVAFAAEAHAVLPVAVERGDRALAGMERVGPLAEAGAAPRLPDLAADRSEHVGDRFAVEAGVRALDLPRHAARARKDHELFRGLRRAFPARLADDERRRQQIVVAAVGARSDQRLVEREVLARNLFRGKRVARAERLCDERHDVGEIDRLVDRVRRIRARRERRIWQRGDCFRAIPRVRDLVGWYRAKAITALPY